MFAANPLQGASVRELSLGRPRGRRVGTPHGKRHREAHPPALADLVPDGGAPAGVRARDQAGRRGLQRDERRRLRAPLLRRPRRARGARHLPEGREAAGGLLRGRALHAAAGELLPAADRVLRTASWPRCRPSLALLDGRFAYAEPLRLALQQLSWGRPSPLGSAGAALGRGRRHGLRRRPRALAAAGQGRDRDLAPQDDRVRLLLDRARRASRSARSTRTTCSTRAASSTSSATRTSATTCASSGCRGSGTRSPTRARPSTTSRRPTTSIPGATRSRADWQLGEPDGTAQVWISERIAWLVERDFGRYGDVEPVARVGQAVAGRARAACPGPGVVFTTEYAQPRQLVAWVLGPRRARAAARADGARRRGSRAPVPRSSSATPGEPDFVAEPAPSAAARRRAGERHRRRATATDQGETPIRPERFARLVALAGILIQSARERQRAAASRRCASACRSPSEELREDVDVLNVVNFGGGSYVLYAEVQGDEIDVDPEPYSDNFARPARLLPLEAKALIAAIDLLGDHLPEGSLAIGAPEDRRPRSARTRRRRASRSPTPRTTTRSWRARSTRAIVESPPAVARVLQGERGRVHRAHGRALRADQRPRGLVPVQLRPRQGGHAPLPARPHQAARRSRRKTFEPRARGRPDRRPRGLAAHRRGARLARRAGLDLARARPLGARAAGDRGGARRTAR